MASEKDIWAPDEDPWFAQAEEAYYALGQAYLLQVLEDALAALNLPDPPREALREARLAKAWISRQEAMRRAQEIYDRLLAGLEKAPPALYRKLAEAITEKWYAEGRLETRAQRRGVAAYLLGLLRGGKEVGLNWRGLLGERERLAVQYAAERAGLYIRKLADDAKNFVARAVTIFFQDGSRQPEDLSRELAEGLGHLNRDWRRVALTEVAHARTGGLLLALPEGAVVEWSAAPDACPVCRKMHGRRFRVRHSPGDPQREVWPGKGWETGPMIPAHPHCRCRFIPVTQPVGEVDPEIEALAQAVIRAATR